jgi:hypothetical protein
MSNLVSYAYVAANTLATYAFDRIVLADPKKSNDGRSHNTEYILGSFYLMSVAGEKVNSEVALQIFFYDVFKAEPERRAGSGRGSRPLPIHGYQGRAHHPWYPPALVTLKEGQLILKVLMEIGD